MGCCDAREPRPTRVSRSFCELRRLIPASVLRHFFWTFYDSLLLASCVTIIMWFNHGVAIGAYTLDRYIYMSSICNHMHIDTVSIGYRDYSTGYHITTTNTGAAPEDLNLNGSFGWCLAEAKLSFFERENIIKYIHTSLICCKIVWHSKVVLVEVLLFQRFKLFGLERPWHLEG